MNKQRQAAAIDENDELETRLVALARVRSRMGTCAHEQLLAAETEFYKLRGRYPGEKPAAT